ncbi:unnamed protein product [Peronospora belbahrii]|uniref:Uncharacterized protein n=1 Tax=Peronospora belbahrii TaxID=622444 RepID=A0AAU9L2D5_9STRA|nr:unnamed protein product [Peronospora belbahrii]
MSIVRRLQARVQHWHLLGRYYVNKWHYSVSKWAECVLYGQSRTGNSPKVASVAFMITRAMRQQLIDAGFPSSAISSLQPAVAQKVIAEKVTFAKFQELQNQHQVEEAAKRAKQMLQQEEEQDQQKSVLVVANKQQEVKQHEETVISGALATQQKKVGKEREVNKT